MCECLISSTFQYTWVHILNNGRLQLNIALCVAYRMIASTLSDVIHERAKKWQDLPWLGDQFGGKSSLFELCNERYKGECKR